MNRRKLTTLVGIGGFLFFVFDRTLKILSLSLWQKPKLIFDSIGWLPAKNSGIAFGLPLPLLLAIILSIFLIALLIAFAIKNRGRLLGLGIWLIVCGAISNLFDRLYYKQAIDYFLFYITSFNLADVLIVIGALFCFFVLLKNEKAINKEKDK